MAQAASRARRSQSLFRRAIVAVLNACAFAYPVLLLVCAGAFWFIGERWWVTAAAMYAPRVLFGIPLPFTLLWALLERNRRLLWAQLAAAGILLFVLLGFVLPWFGPRRSNEPSLSLLTFNVDSAFAGANVIAQKITELSPDVVLLQEVNGANEALSHALADHYRYIDSSTQFVLASRYPILQSTPPARLPFYGRERSPRFMRYLIGGPWGPVAVFSLHPVSPRGVMHIHRFHGLFHQLRTGALLAGDPENDVASNAALRALQVEFAGKQAAHEQAPVIIAGDTNLPGLSRALHESFSNFSDAFRVASWGFGYTFPSRFRFLRLDRVLVGPELQAVSFRVGCPGASDHSCVVAEIQRR